MYIEIKDYEFYKKTYEIDMAEELFNQLQSLGELGKLPKDINSTIPIIIRSSETAALKKFATLSDLPLVKLLSEKETLMPQEILPEVSKYAHGVGPHTASLFRNEFMKHAKN